MYRSFVSELSSKSKVVKSLLEVASRLLLFSLNETEVTENFERSQIAFIYFVYSYLNAPPSICWIPLFPRTLLQQVRYRMSIGQHVEMLYLNNTCFPLN